MPFPNNPTEAPVDVYPYIALTFLKGWPYKTRVRISLISLGRVKGQPKVLTILSKYLGVKEQ